MKIVTIVGARPQFIKAAVVSRAFRKSPVKVTETIIHTGQHYDGNMSDVFFEEMSIPKPKYNLGIGGGTHGENTGRMLESIEKVLLKERPDWVIVYGDTDSTLAGALAAAKLQIPVAHVEAGLRSFNRRMPEEINRILTDRVSDLLFTPTDTATKNLIKEGVCVNRIQQVGDVMYDAVLYYSDKIDSPIEFIVNDDFILCTIHRAENVDDLNNLSNIISALNEIARRNPVVLPIHPRTKNRLGECNCDIGNLTLIDPVGYFNMLWLLRQCKLVITDSGGLQKEAYFLGKPCITTRDETEWVELLNCGANVLAGANKEKIIEYSKNVIMDAPNEFAKGLYGDGDAGDRVVELLGAK